METAEFNKQNAKKNTSEKDWCWNIEENEPIAQSNFNG